MTRFERADQVARTFELRHWRPWFAAGLGLAYAWAGRLDEAFPLFQEAAAETAASQFFFGHAIRVAWEAEAHLLAGHTDQARSGAAQALDLARQHKERGHEAWVRRLLGEIAACADPPDLESADAHYRQALALAEELSMRPLVAHCHLGLGTLYRRAGKHEQAREYLTTAGTMYREMDMRFWLEQAEAASAEGG
jgi:tetratricopeptide (TPR) repeat protein